MNKILIIRLSSIGDIVLTTPVIRCLSQQLPGAELHYLTKKQFHPILSSNKYIHKVWLFENNFDELIPALQAEGFSFIVDLHRNFRSRFLILKLRKPSATFPKLNIKKWLLVKLKWNLLPSVHIVDRYFKAVEQLGVKNDGKGLDYFLTDDEEITLNEAFGCPNKPYIAFSIGGQHYTKILPEEKVIEFCNAINDRVVLLGGKEDMERGERIINATSGKVLNGCGKFSINQSASLIRQSKMVITNDTGLMHIAAAFRKPILSVWGNTVPEFGMYPYLPQGSPEHRIFEVKGLPCRPCSKIGFKKCPKGHFRCMRDQKMDELLACIK